MKKVFLVLSFFFVTLSNVSSQYYDGWLDFVGKVAYEPGTSSYAIFGAEAGLGKYLSAGMSFKYLLTSDIPSPNSPFNLDSDGKIGFSLRADIHGFYLLGLKRSDILIGYNLMHGTSGAHAEYRYFFNEFLAVYGRGKYHFDNPKLTPLSDYFLENKLRFELGFIFKTISGESYDSSDW